MAALALAVAAAGAACVYKTDQSSSVGEVCGSMSSFLGTCAGSTACGAAVASECSQVSTGLSDTILNGLIYCGQGGYSCDGGAVLASGCMFSGLSIPTAAQTQLAEDFCAKCGDAPSCANAFYSYNGVGVSTAPVVAALDPLVSSIDEACVPPLDPDAGSAACTAAFVACARPLLAAQVYLPAACIGEAGVLGALWSVSADGG